MKKVLAGVLVLMMVFAFVGCGSDESDEPEKKTSFAVGETAEVDGAKFTVTDVQYSQGDDWDKPADGMEYVIVNISIENGSDEDLDYNLLDWQMINSQGQEESISFTIIDSDTNLGSGTLKPGGTKSGTLVFEEPKEDESLKLTYYSNVLIDDETEFEVVIK